MNLNFKSKVNYAEEDQKLLLELMDKAIQGDFSPVDASMFHDPEIAEKYKMIPIPRAGYPAKATTCSPLGNRSLNDGVIV